MFTTRIYQSEEQYDLSKVINFVGDTYDYINSPFLNKLKTLKTATVYNTSEGYRHLDQISEQIYQTPYMVYYIMLFNNLVDDELPEGTTLNLFSLTDFINLYQEISIGNV